MSLKAELETWAAALKAYDEEDFEKALEMFSRIADSSKILTNMGLIYATLGDHETAIERFTGATRLDQFLAVAYFQWGVSNFLLSDYEGACNNFDEALGLLRGNQDINYEQLGLKFKLYAAEVLFNKGICQIYMGREQEGMGTLSTASQLKVIDDHSVIDEAIRDRGDNYNVFSVPIGVLYRPSEKKLKNAVTKDYMGKAKLVAASDPTDIYTEFSGAARLREGITPAGIFLDRGDSSPPLARTATAPNARLPVPREFDIVPKSASAVERSKTTLNVPTNYRERIAARPAELAPTNGNSPVNSKASPPMARGNATVNGSKSLRSLARGPSTRREAPANLNIPPIPENPNVADNALPPQNMRAGAEKRVSDFYDNYLDPYDGIDDAQPSQAYPSANDWKRGSPVGRGPGSLRSAPVGGSMRRRTTKRSNYNRAPSYYEEEEEGYGSGSYEEYEMQKIRVKIHYRDEVRGMTIMADAPFAEFMDKLTAKFDKSLIGLGIKFKDEDGIQVSLRDESDFEMAVETAREATKGKSEGKLEIWCTDL